MRDISNKLKNRKIKHENILNYGFTIENKSYIYKTSLFDNQFEAEIVISDQKSYSKLIDLESKTEFILVDIENTQGEFVGKLKQEYDKIIEDIIAKCTDKEVFKNKQTKEIINYVSKKYNDKLEFLWEKFDNNAIWRNKQNNKWYGILLIIPENKLNMQSDKIIEVLDLRCQKEKVQEIVDNKKIFNGYHMNKKSWITIKLDNTIDTKTIYDLIDNSYNLSIGNKCGLTGENLSKKVYEYLTTIPKGKVVTYKQIAESIGNKGLARVVGNILHKNPNEDKYPCYKVINSKGELAENFVFGGKEKQRRKLEEEGIKVLNNKVDLNEYQWK